jgi:hypothetical protein
MAIGMVKKLGKSQGGFITPRLAVNQGQFQVSLNQVLSSKHDESGRKIYGFSVGADFPSLAVLAA